MLAIKEITRGSSYGVAIGTLFLNIVILKLTYLMELPLSHVSDFLIIMDLTAFIIAVVLFLVSIVSEK